MSSRSHYHKKAGFSLIELLVSISIYIIVITMGVGTLLVLIDANAKAQSIQDVMTNLTFAIDSMTREIRTGRGFYCSDVDPGGNLSEFVNSNCATGGQYISIVEGGNSLTGDGEPRITYRFNDANESIERRIGDNGWFAITSPTVHITDGAFYLEDSDTGIDGDTTQVNVTIFIDGYAGSQATVDSSFQLQTTIVKRILDI